MRDAPVRAPLAHPLLQAARPAPFLLLELDLAPGGLTRCPGLLFVDVTIHGCR
jgi:hypothetical protein